MRPIEHLPLPHPKDFDPGADEPDYFYNNFARHFIPDMIQMMDAGLYINQNAVEELRKTVETVLVSVTKRLEANSLIIKFQLKCLPYAQKAYAEKCTQSVREVEHYLKEFKSSDVLHRTWVVNTYLHKIHKPEDVKDKWILKDLKKYNIFLKDPFIAAICDKRRLTENKDIKAGMVALAEYKLELWNRPRYEKAEKPVVLDPFNPGSPKQMKEFFEMMEVEPIAFTDTGEPSWGRDEVELVAKVTPEGDFADALSAMVDFSFGSIIRNNFLKAFDRFTVDGVLHGNIKLFGAKSFRNTSNSPNLLNMPSTKSIYAKPLKKCFVAPKGYVVYAIDYAALEDRGIANLTGDTNKCNIFLEGLDGHSLNACGYFPELIEAIMGPNTDNVAYVREFRRLEDEEGHVELGKIRFDSKAPTFKLAYGGYPDDDKGGVITQEIFDNYHTVLYPGITDYRENYVLPTAKRQGYIHLGLGCRLYTSDPNGQIRTLHNATCQFWSILTLIAVNELNYQARVQNMTEAVIPHSTIYDSIYIYVKKDAESIKWLNDTLVPIMNTDYLEDTIVPNECVGEISDSWTNLIKIKNNASIEEIQKALDEIQERKLKGDIGFKLSLKPSE